MDQKTCLHLGAGVCTVLCQVGETEIKHMDLWSTSDLRSLPIDLLPNMSLWEEISNCELTQIYNLSLHPTHAFSKEKVKLQPPQCTPRSTSTNWLTCPRSFLNIITSWLLSSLLEMSSSPRLNCLRQQSAPISAFGSILGGIFLGVAIRFLLILTIMCEIFKLGVVGENYIGHPNTF